MCKISVLKNRQKIWIPFLLIVVTFVYARGQQSMVMPIANHDTTSNYFSVKANGRLLSTAQYKDIHYTSFQQSGNVTIIIKCSEKINDFIISPLSKNIRGKVVGKNSIQFNLPQPSYCVIKVNNKNRLFLFAEQFSKDAIQGNVNIQNYNIDTTGKTLNTIAIQRAINETSFKRQTLFFPAGIYKTGRLTIPSHGKIFLAAGALLKASDDLANFVTSEHQRSKGFINIVNAEDVTIRGLGVIDGNGRQLRDKYGDGARMRLVFLNGCKNVSINGVIQRDPGSWNTQIMYSQNVAFKHVKLLNDVALSNTDGFDPDASLFVSIENCFAYCGDDNVAIKITQDTVANSITSDISVTGCVFLTRKSSLKVGTESRGLTIKNILFENNDVILSDRGMALYCSDGAVYNNIKYINNNFEENYPDTKRSGIFFEINKRNPNSKIGVMKKIVIKNCSFQVPFPNLSTIAGFDEEHKIDVTIDHLKIAGNLSSGFPDGMNKRSPYSEILIK